MATEQLVSELRNRLKDLNAFHDAELIRRPNEWGTINFESASDDIALVLSIAQDLSGLPLQYLTDNAAQQITQSIPPVVDHLNSINEFTLEQGGNPTGTRESLSNGLHQVAEHLNTTSSPFIPYLAYRRGDIAENISALNKALSDSKDSLRKAESWTDKKKHEISEIVRAAREAAASAGVATFTQEFDAEKRQLCASDLRIGFVLRARSRYSPSLQQSCSTIGRRSPWMLAHGKR